MSLPLVYHGFTMGLPWVYHGFPLGMIYKDLMASRDSFCTFLYPTFRKSLWKVHHEPCPVQMEFPSTKGVHGCDYARVCCHLPGWSWTTFRKSLESSWCRNGSLNCRWLLYIIEDCRFHEKSLWIPSLTTTYYIPRNTPQSATTKIRRRHQYLQDPHTIPWPLNWKVIDWLTTSGVGLLEAVKVALSWSGGVLSPWNSTYQHVKKNTPTISAMGMQTILW